MDMFHCIRLCRFDERDIPSKFGFSKKCSPTLIPSKHAVSIQLCCKKCSPTPTGIWVYYIMVFLRGS